MNTSVISSAYAYSSVQPKVADLPQSAKQRDSIEGHDGGSARVGRGSGGDGVLGTVFQTLKQLGLNVPAQSTSKPTANQAANQPSALGGSDIKQALHSFMHDIFQSARTANSSGNAISSAGAANNSSDGKHYGELASKIDGLAQQLNSSGGSDALSNLKSSFNNLVKALENGSSSGKESAAGKVPSLQDFLHKLSQNLQGGTLNPVGSLVSTAA